MASSKPSRDVGGADLELATRIRSGKTGALETLYRQHAGRLYNLASRMTAGSADAEDLLQDVFLLAYRKIGSYRGDASLGTWLYRLAMNHCTDVPRSRQIRMGQVNRIDLERAIESLPPACRATFLLYDVEGFGHNEVADILGVSAGTSKSQVHKARLRIRAHLGTRA